MGIPDRPRMEAAIRSFLLAAGLDPDRPDLMETPARVTEAWVTEFLDGYQDSPEAVLRETFPAPEASDLVIVSGLELHSTCPHHLLPYRGVAHLAYLPGSSIVGFGRLSALVDLFAHRLVLQEELARQVAEALVGVLGARGASCAIRAEQACLRMRGEEQPHAVTYVESHVGMMRESAELRGRFARVIGP